MAAPTAAMVTTPIAVWQHQMGMSTPVLQGLGGAGTITAGMPLIMSSGLLVPAAGSNADDTELVGLSMSNSTVTGTRINYVPFWPGIVFVGQLLSVGSETGVTTPGDAHRFESYGLGVSGTGSRYFFDVDNTTDNLFCIIDILDVATAKGRVLATPNNYGRTVWGAA